MKKVLFNILFLLIFNFVQGQSNPTLELAKSLDNSEVEITDLTDFVSQNISEKREIAKFYYYWISLNIEYDFEKRAKNRANRLTGEETTGSSNAILVFKEKKAICSGFASLFKLFMDLSKIECTIVSGHVKSLENLTLELESDDNYRHAWNSIKISDSWILVDTTWAQQFEEDISDYYFDTKPKRLILSHYPLEDKWQLMSDHISIDNFNQQPYVHSFYFDTGFGELPKLTNDKEYYYIEFPINPSNNWLTKLTYSSEDIENESIFPEYEKKENSNVFKFKKKGLPKNSILNVVVTYFDWDKQTKAEYNDIIKYQL